MLFEFVTKIKQLVPDRVLPPINYFSYPPTIATHERTCGMYPDKPKQFCETCKQEYPNYREENGEFSKHVEKCQKWYEIGVDQKDHKTCKLCQHEFDSIGYLLVHLDKEYCTKEKSEQVCPNCSCNYSKLRSVDFVKHTEKCEKYYKDVIDGNTCGLCNKKFDSMGKKKRSRA